jgi:hypothetical protein
MSAAYNGQHDLLGATCSLRFRIPAVVSTVECSAVHIDRSSAVSNGVVRFARTCANRLALLWFADSIGDDVKPTDMRAFKIPAGKGVYIHPGTWHNGFYVNKRYTLQPYVQGASALRVLTRQGAVHARVSVSWLNEFSTLLRINLG